MAKPLISWLVLSFSQPNLRLLVSERCLHVSVTKFWHKFASLRQVNTPSSWDKFQNCCTDMYLIRFLANFAVFCVFLWISRICLNFAAPRPREISVAMTCMLNFSNKWIIFLLSFHAVFITEFCFSRLPQMAVIKRISNLYWFPVFFGQVYFVLVLTSTNHNARNRYPEMVTARTVYRNLINFKILEQMSSCCIV